MNELFCSNRSAGSESSGPSEGSSNRHRARSSDLIQLDGVLPFDRSALQLIDLWSINFRETHHGWFSYLVEGYALFGLRGLFLDRTFTLFVTLLLARLACQTDSPLSCPFLIVPVYVHFSVNDLYNYVLLLRRYQDGANSYSEDDASDVTVATVASTCTSNEAKGPTSRDLPIACINVKPVETDREPPEEYGTDGISSGGSGGDENVDMPSPKVAEPVATIRKTREEILAEHKEKIERSTKKALEEFEIRADISDLKSKRAQMVVEQKKDERRLDRQRMESESGDLQIGKLFAANYRGVGNNVHSTNNSGGTISQIPSPKSEVDKTTVTSEREEKPLYASVARSLKEGDFVKEDARIRTLTKKDCVKNYEIRKKFKPKRWKGKKRKPLPSRKPVAPVVTTSNYYDNLSVEEKGSKSEEPEISDVVNHNISETQNVTALEKLQAIPSRIHDLPKPSIPKKEYQATSNHTQHSDDSITSVESEKVDVAKAPSKVEEVKPQKVKPNTWYDSDEEKSWDNSEFSLNITDINRRIEQLTEDLATLDNKTVRVVSLDGVDLSYSEIGDIAESRMKHNEPSWDNSRKLTDHDVTAVRKKRQRELDKKDRKIAISQQYDVFLKKHGFDNKYQYNQLKKHVFSTNNRRLKKIFPTFSSWANRGGGNHDESYEETRKYWDPNIWNIKGAKVNFRTIWTPKGINLTFDKR